LKSSDADNPDAAQLTPTLVTLADPTVPDQFETLHV
jgi:hypothetical protein